MEKIKSAKLKIEYKSMVRLFKKMVAQILIIACCSCTGFLEIEPPQDQLIRTVVFENDRAALSTLAGIYGQMVNASGFASGRPSGVTVVAGFSSDEFTPGISTAVNEFYEHALTPISTGSRGLWISAYNIIYQTNAIIEGQEHSIALSSEVKELLEGEAKFIRAFCYFYLVNLFGDVPLPLSTDYRINSVLPRESAAKIYSQIVSDLSDAARLLKTDYSTSNGERVKPNRNAALALLSRTYLFMNKWAEAETAATQIIEQKALFDTVGLNDVFLSNSKETIWQLKPIAPTINTWEGNTFIWTGASGVSIRDNLFDAFEEGDSRKSAWIGRFNLSGAEYRYPFKYKIKTGGTPLHEYSMVLRLAEQYLIRAEARANQGDLDGSKSDLNVIRQRAGLTDTFASSAQTLLEAIERERQVELFAEWGHRWLDLKRTNRIDDVLGAVKENWSFTKRLYPIPLTEMDRNHNLRPQNDGY